MDNYINHLEFTGERMIPESSDKHTFLEHIYRYRFAKNFVRGRRVLDIACGEGYGSAALIRAGASSLVGVDISPEACNHARRKYGVDARVGDVTNIPLPDRSVDLVVSFETIEHVSNPAKFIDECARVLTRDGTLIISTPNRDTYRHISGNNPFHCSEMCEEEFVGLLRSRFNKVSLYSQHPRSVRWWSLRGFATEERWPDSWWWWKVKGFKRIKSIMSSRLCRHVNGEIPNKFRQDAVGTILDKDKIFSHIFNIYTIHPQSILHSENPVYMIATVKSLK